MTRGICKGMRIIRSLKELKITLELPLKLYFDNKVAINITHNHV